IDEVSAHVGTSKKELVDDYKTLEDLEENWKSLHTECTLHKILEMSNRDIRVKKMKTAFKIGIVLANEKGQPKGQALYPKGQDMDPKGQDREPKEKNESENEEVADHKGKEKETEMSKLKRKIRDLEDAEKRKKKKKVVECVKKVRKICMIKDAKQADISMELDDLIEVAKKTGHKELNTYEEMSRYAGKYGDRIDLSNFIMTSLSSSGDKVFKNIAKCIKNHDLVEKKSEKKDQKSESDSKTPWQNIFSFGNPMFPMPQFGSGYHGQGYQYPNFQRGGYNAYRPRFRGSYRGRAYFQGQILCDFCNSPDHQIR
ncbi:unnamed protein product, partial [Owenia fusiformis]